MTGESHIEFLKAGGGAGDNLGDHTATQALDMAGNDITNADVISNAGNMQLRPLTSGGLGSQVIVQAGTSGPTGNGGLLDLRAGQSGGTGRGGHAYFTGGQSNSAEGGNVTVKGGEAAGGSLRGGHAYFGGGESDNGPGGHTYIFGGQGGLNDPGGNIDITTGAAGASGGNSGALNLRTGAAPAGDVGDILMQPADATGAGTGADLTIQGGRGNTAGRTFLLGATGGQSGVDGGYVAVLGGLNNGAALGGNVRIKAGGSSVVNNGEVVLEGAAGFELVDFGSIGGNTTWNPLSGTVGRVTITAALILSLGTLNKGDIGAEMLLVITNGGANVTWGATVQWAGGSAPALTAAGTDVLKFTTVDAGASWQAWPVGLDFS